jgi:hypothetical protein
MLDVWAHHAYLLVLMYNPNIDPANMCRAGHVVFY